MATPLMRGVITKRCILKNRILQILILLTLPVGTTLANSPQKELSIECSATQILAHEIICNSKSLTDKHNALLSLYNLPEHSKKKRYGQKISVNAWVITRHLCTSAECIDILYTTRILQVAESVHANDMYYENCSGATVTCFLKERFYLGVYQGSQVILDHVDTLHCFKGCDPKESKFYVYEIKNGVRDRETEWSGEFRGHAFIDDSHIFIQQLPERSTKQINEVIFVSKIPACDGCAQPKIKIVRGSSGWKLSETENSL